MKILKATTFSYFKESTILSLSAFIVWVPTDIILIKKNWNVKNRNKIDKNVFLTALKRYSRSKEKNLKLLMEYSELMNIEKSVKQYIEGLLVWHQNRWKIL